MNVVPNRSFGSAIRRLCALFITVGSMIVLSSCGDPEPIKIGFIGGLTGRSADIGEASRNAVQLFVDKANAGGGVDGRKIELIVLDDQNDPSVAVQAMQELHAAGVVAIIGPNVSSVGASMMPTANELKLVTISPTASSLIFADHDDYFFRINWTTRDNAKIYARHFFSKGVTRLAVAIDGNNRVFSQSWLEQFSVEYNRLGGKVVDTEAFMANQERGYSDTARNLIHSDPQAILLVSNSIDTAQLAQQIRKYDENILLGAAEWAASERLLFLGGTAIEGIELVQSYNRTDQSPRYQDFRTAYMNAFSREPGYASLAAHDAATILFKAISEQGEGRSLRQALLDIEPVQGLQQMVKFNKYGDAQRSAFMVVVRNGQFEPL